MKRSQPKSDCMKECEILKSVQELAQFDKELTSLSARDDIDTYVLSFPDRGNKRHSTAPIFNTL